MRKNNLFLTADWRKLIMANYIVAPSLLTKFLPKGTELDYWNHKCYISLVAFLFDKVRVKGAAIPFHTCFPEVNLRFYVKFNDNGVLKRGVVFIKEIVPLPAVTFIANSLFKEHYATMPMRYAFENKDEALHVFYEWKKNATWQTISVVADKTPQLLVEGSEEEFITEHYWGYSNQGRRTTEYQVAHKKWDTYKINSYSINCNFGSIYGNEFDFLVNEKPVSIFLAEGSAIEIYNRKFH